MNVFGWVNVGLLALAGGLTVARLYERPRRALFAAAGAPMDSPVWGWIDAALFFGGGLICQGFALSLFYEGIAVGTGKVPPISDIVAGTVLANPRWSYVFTALAFLLIGALLVHFLGWAPGKG